MQIEIFLNWKLKVDSYQNVKSHILELMYFYLEKEKLRNVDHKPRQTFSRLTVSGTGALMVTKFRYKANQSNSLKDKLGPMTRIPNARASFPHTITQCIISFKIVFRLTWPRIVL